MQHYGILAGGVTVIFGMLALIPRFSLFKASASQPLRILLRCACIVVKLKPKHAKIKMPATQCEIQGFDADVDNAGHEPAIGQHTLQTPDLRDEDRKIPFLEFAILSSMVALAFCTRNVSYLCWGFKIYSAVSLSS